jgi:hypothetical protein
LSRYTNTMIAYSVFDDFNYDLLIDWAIDLLEENITTQSIQIAAGLEKPVNVFEARKYIETILEELNLLNFTKDEKIRFYCAFFVEEIILEIDIRQNLKILYKTHQSLDSKNDLYDFYLLYWAWDDLDTQEYTPYWSDANKDNIKDIVINISKDWINNFYKEKENPTIVST